MIEFLESIPQVIRICFVTILIGGILADVAIEALVYSILKRRNQLRFEREKKKAADSLRFRRRS